MHDLVLAAVDVLAKAGVKVAKVSIPAHHAIRTAQAALTAEGALALFHTGFFGAFTRTYYPASLIAAINQLWASQADVLAPRTKWLSSSFSKAHVKTIGSDSTISR
jgi:amidase